MKFKARIKIRLKKEYLLIHRLNPFGQDLRSRLPGMK